jgi:hypothetical protein
MGGASVVSALVFCGILSLSQTMRTQAYTAIVHRENRWYVAECPEAGVVPGAKRSRTRLRISKEPLNSISRRFLHPTSKGSDHDVRRFVCPGVWEGSHSRTQKIGFRSGSQERRPRCSENENGCWFDCLRCSLQDGLATGNSRGILKQAGVELDDFAGMI